jgi:hypothetical protein
MGGSAGELRKILAPGSCVDPPVPFIQVGVRFARAGPNVSRSFRSADKLNLVESSELFPELPELLIHHVLLG